MVLETEFKITSSCRPESESSKQRTSLQRGPGHLPPPRMMSIRSSTSEVRTRSASSCPTKPLVQFPDIFAHSANRIAVSSIIQVCDSQHSNCCFDADRLRFGDPMSHLVKQREAAPPPPVIPERMAKQMKKSGFIVPQVRAPAVAKSPPKVRRSKLLGKAGCRSQLSSGVSRV